MHSFHGRDNETLTKLRVERIERQIQEIKLQTQNDVQYRKEELERQKSSYKRKIDKMDDSVKALSYLLVDVVKHLRDRHQSLLDEAANLEKDIKSELSIQVKLTKESQEINERTLQVVNEIAVSQKRSLRLATYVESLNNLQDDIRSYFPVDVTKLGKGLSGDGQSEDDGAIPRSPPRPGAPKLPWAV